VDSTGRFVAAGERYGQVWLWERDRRSRIVSRVLPSVTVRLLASSSAGSAAVVDWDDRILCFERGLSGEATMAAAPPFAPMHLLPTDGRRFILIAEDGRLAMLDGGGSVNELQGLPKLEIPVMAAAATDVPIIAVKEPHNRITIARICEGMLVPVRTIEVGSAIFGLALDPHGEHLFAVVSNPYFVVLSWAVTPTAGEPVELLRMRRAGLPPVPMSALDGRLVAGDQDDLVLVLVDEMPPAPVWVGGHDEPVKCIAASAHMIASVACWFQDTNVDQVRLWTEDGHLLGPIVLPEHAVNVALLPDAAAAIAVSTSGALWRLELSSENLIGVARRIAGRSLSAEEERRYGIDIWRARRSSAGTKESTPGATAASSRAA
jgi:hypothetical protein